MTIHSQNRFKTLYIIHHSHTDIGYTETQSRIERWQVDFIRQALRILDDSRGRIGEHFGGFKWVCETFWVVERFLEHATPEEIEDFADAVKSGDIGISANYLNLTELLDWDILFRMIDRAAAYGQSIGVPVDCAMTADINGHGWGFSRALCDHGVRNLFSCVHTHHGMYPLGRRQIAFWWETPTDDRLLVWSGEHYHFANELGVVPDAVSSYLTKDECDAEMIFSDHWSVAKIRIPRYLERLENEGYPYNFVPVMASGLRTDNAPPNAGIVDFVARWNEEYGHRIRVEMTTLSEFFSRVRNESDVLPVYRGDWPDWWSDGAASVPGTTKMFRRAQRDHGYYKRLLERYPELVPVDTESIDYELSLYAEHTFGHSDSMGEPWNPLVHSISSRKKSFATSAGENIDKALDAALERLGATTLAADMPLRYKIINPLERDVTGIARLPVYDFEFHERGLDKGAKVRDTSTNMALTSRRMRVPRGVEYEVHVVLPAGSEKVLSIEPIEAPTGRTRRAQHGESDREPPENTPIGDTDSIETPFVRIRWDDRTGISRWVDRSSGKDLLASDHIHAPFSPVYEITPVDGPDDICAVRGQMGLNRKGRNARRWGGRFVGAGEIETGGVLSSAALEFDVEGMRFYKVRIDAYAGEPRVDIAIRLHKKSVWEPENVYVALPFAAGGVAFDTWLDKCGAIVRPRKDQLPGTLTDFYSIQEGIALSADDFGVVIATPDTHLVQLGALEYGPRPLAGDAVLENATPAMYVWLMTNFWETNFEANLGGFYEFRFSVLWGPEFCDPSLALKRCRDINHGIRCFRLKTPGNEK